MTLDPKTAAAIESRVRIACPHARASVTHDADAAVSVTVVVDGYAAGLLDRVRFRALFESICPTGKIRELNRTRTEVFAPISELDGVVRVMELASVDIGQRLIGALARPLPRTGRVL